MLIVDHVVAIDMHCITVVTIPQKAIVLVLNFVLKYLPLYFDLSKAEILN